MKISSSSSGIKRRWDVVWPIRTFILFFFVLINNKYRRKYLRVLVKSIAAAMNRQITAITTNAMLKPFQFCFLLVPPTNSYRQERKKKENHHWRRLPIEFSSIIYSQKLTIQNEQHWQLFVSSSPVSCCCCWCCCEANIKIFFL